MSYAVQVWSCVLLVFIQTPHEITAAYAYVKKMPKTNVSRHSNNKGLDLHHVPIFLTGTFCYNIKSWSFYTLTCNLMASSMIMTLVISFQFLFYSHLLHKPMVSTEIPSSPNGQVKISYWCQYQGHTSTSYLSKWILLQISETSNRFW